MNAFLLFAAVLIVFSIAVAMMRILWIGQDSDRIMAVQLLATGGISALLLFAVVNQQNALLDVALTLAVLTAFAGIAFVQAYRTSSRQSEDEA